MELILNFVEDNNLSSVKRETHSHPNWGIAGIGPSDGDKKSSTTLQSLNTKYNGNVKSRVYDAERKNYLDYDKDGIIKK